MKKQLMTFTISILGVLLIVLYCFPALGGNRIKEGMNLPDFMLEGSDCMNKTDYLGVESDDRYLQLSKIKAKLMVIEFFQVQCPVCQKQASVANKIFKIIQRNPDLTNDVKIFAVSIGNRQAEIDAYKKQHRVKFPLFVDRHSKLSNQHGFREIPYTMIVNKDLKVLYAHAGVIENLDEFVAKITKFHKEEL